MYDGATIVVVVVAYNEEGLVGEVIDTLPDFVDRVYAVDDASTDGTWAEITARADAPRQPAVPDGGRGQRVVPIRHERNRGVGGAMKTGFSRALDDGFDVLVTVAGDGQMDPDRMADLVDPVVAGRADVAKGNRLDHDATRDEMSAFRYAGNVLLTGLTRVASGYWGLTDPQNGYTAVSSSALEAVDVDALYEDYGSLNDLWVRLNVANVRLADVSMPAIYGEESSDIDYTSFVPALSLLLVRRFYWRLWQKYVVRELHPLAGLHALGLSSLAAGLGLGVRSALTGASDGGDDAPVASDGANLLLAVFGAALVLAGLALDWSDNAHLVCR